MTAAKIRIRPCVGFEEFDACTRLQTEVWGYDVKDIVPQREFLVIQHIGGQVIGAFDTDSGEEGAPSMVGFAMAMPGIDRSGSYLHSHMLAVLPGYRNAGIGRSLKLAQREDALRRGIGRMKWTFDPLEIKNAYLNITRLGAFVRSYSPNFYGVSSSRLQAGLPADRLHAEWMMDSPRVDAALAGDAGKLPDTEETIVVPGSISELKQDPARLAEAEEIQAEIRTRFLEAFRQGLAVIGFALGQSAQNDGLVPVEWKKAPGASELDGIYQLGQMPQSLL